ncbi:MAG: thioesterase family protein [Pseudomonadota bacterium]
MDIAYFATGNPMTQFFTPYHGTVLPAWLDYNQHMNVAYYTLAFDHAMDAAFEEWHIGADYGTSQQRSLFAVEQHIVYDRELLADASFEVITYPASVAPKKLHLIMAMRHREDGYLAATQEHLFIHVDMVARRAVPWSDDIYQRLIKNCAAYDAVKQNDDLWQTHLAPRLNRAILKK